MDHSRENSQCFLLKTFLQLVACIAAASVIKISSSGPSWKSRRARCHGWTSWPQLRLGYLFYYKPLVIVSGFHHQRLPAILPFCHFQQNTALVPKHFKTYHIIIIRQKLESYLTLKSKFNFYLSSFNLYFPAMLNILEKPREFQSNIYFFLYLFYITTFLKDHMSFTHC